MNRFVSYLFVLCISCLCVGKCLAQNGVYTNPIWSEDFPDPAILHSSDGSYYAYATNGKLQGKHCNIRILKSDDLIHWLPVGDALPELGSFNSISRSNWAPHVTEYKGKYYLYYSTNMDTATKSGKQAMGIAVAVSDKPTGPFVTTDEPLIHGEGFENIDPMLFIDPETSRKILYWGSMHRPIHAREMDDDLIHFKADSEVVDVLACDEDSSYERLLEGPWVIKKGGKYYLFVSGDNCCGDGAHYAVLVARANDPLGPFVRRAQGADFKDSVILSFNGRWLAPGHNSVLTDDAGEQWLFYHAYDINKIKSSSDGKRVLAGREMLMDKLIWDNGWPLVVEPSFQERPVPFVEKNEE